MGVECDGSFSSLEGAPVAKPVRDHNENTLDSTQKYAQLSSLDISELEVSVLNNDIERIAAEELSRSLDDTPVDDKGKEFSCLEGAPVAKPVCDYNEIAVESVKEYAELTRPNISEFEISVLEECIEKVDTEGPWSSLKIISVVEAPDTDFSFELPRAKSLCDSKENSQYVPKKCTKISSLVEDPPIVEVTSKDTCLESPIAETVCDSKVKTRSALKKCAEMRIPTASQRKQVFLINNKIIKKATNLVDDRVYKIKNVRVCLIPLKKKPKIKKLQNSENPIIENPMPLPSNTKSPSPLSRKYRSKKPSVPPKPQKPVVHTCEICDKTFKHFFLMKKHKRTHIFRRYKCQLCKKELENSSNLVKHMRIHNNVRPFECELCHKKFIVNTALKRHKRTHTGEKPYKCDMCPFRSSEGGNLNKHKRSCHKDLFDEDILPKSMKNPKTRLAKKQKVCSNDEVKIVTKPRRKVKKTRTKSADLSNNEEKEHTNKLVDKFNSSKRNESKLDRSTKTTDKGCELKIPAHYSLRRRKRKISYEE